MRFGALIPSGWVLDLADIPVEEQLERILDVTRTVEATNFDSAWMVDHFHTTPQPTNCRTPRR
jgi:alkanesulfonate monooxygenase SsuD/methylene tetrahydromethanopterin reductase-like flavin-dependent oxidoreductase (luciferase family)